MTEHDDAARPGELTVDELARTVGLTVRNVRAYAGRGLLPAPRLVGRTGYYGVDHVNRLTLVKEMLEQGWSLAGVEKLLLESPTGASASVLSLHRALMTPWADEPPEDVPVSQIIADADVEVTPEIVAALIEFGVIEVTDPSLETVRVLQPSLLRAGLQVIRLGVPTIDALRAQAEVAVHARAMAAIYVRVFVDTVWRPFVEKGMPEGGWEAVLKAVDTALPVSAQAALAAFRRAMKEAVDATLADELRHLVGVQPG